MRGQGCWLGGPGAVGVALGASGWLGRDQGLPGRGELGQQRSLATPCTRCQPPSTPHPSLDPVTLRPQYPAAHGPHHPHHPLQPTGALSPHLQPGPVTPGATGPPLTGAASPAGKPGSAGSAHAPPIMTSSREGAGPRTSGHAPR